ncbi:MAG: Ger(x)C family spore germination C-terminal domain-containing protein [Bacilli bacterium]
MKKILLILCLLLCSGCSDYVEINDLVVIPGMIIDYKDESFEITSELILNDEKSSIKVITTKCKMIDKCLSDISNELNKNILIYHLKVLILTKDVLKNNVDFYDYFLRNSKSKMNYDVFVTDQKYVKDLFKVNTNSSGVSLYIEQLAIYNKKLMSSSMSLSFIDLVYKNLEKGLDPLFPNITIKEDENGEKNINLDDLIFFKDNKEITLNENQSINYNILTNNVGQSVIDLECDGGSFSINIDSIKTKKNWKDNTMNFNIKLVADVNNYKCNYDLNDKNTIKKLNKLTEKELIASLNDVINISKTNNYDFLGIINYIYKHDNKYYNKIKDNLDLNNIKTNIDINVAINSIGEKRR